MHRLGLGGGLRMLCTWDPQRLFHCESGCFLLEERGTARSGIARPKCAKLWDLKPEGLNWNARLFLSLNRWNG
jgi:hypothetical protein